MTELPATDSWEFRLSPDRLDFAVYDPGKGRWFVPNAPMCGQWVDAVDMDRMGWARYLPADDPTTDRPRALHLLEAADFLRDAHFRDGLSVQEAITALRHMADEADPMVGSLARDGFGLDEIAAMPAAPVAAPPTGQAGLRDRIADVLLTTHHREHGYHANCVVCAGDVNGLADAVMVALRGLTLRELELLHRPNTTPSRPDPHSTAEAHRLALSTALGLGTSAPWDAIRVRAAELAGQGVAGDRAAVLREGAAALDADMERFFSEWPDEPRNSPYVLGRKDAADLLRRLAAETPGPETQGEIEPCADYEATTGHAITCLAVAGGASDPDCPACHPKFGIDGCTCIPFTRQDGTPRYCGPTDTVDMISGWEPGGDCPHHAPPTPLAKIVRWIESEPVTANTEFGNGYRACQRDIRDLVKGRFDNDPQPTPPAVVAEPGKEN